MPKENILYIAESKIQNVLKREISKCHPLRFGVAFFCNFGIMRKGKERKSALVTPCCGNVIGMWFTYPSSIGRMEHKKIMELSEKILKLRKQAGLSQQDVAERLGVSRQAISRWETGAVSPSADSLKMIGQLFKVPVDYLLDDEAEPEEAPKRLPGETDFQEVPEHTSGEPEQTEANAKKSRRKKYLAALLAAAIAVAVGFYLWIRQPENFNRLQGVKIETAEESVAGRVVDTFSFDEW